MPEPRSKSAATPAPARQVDPESAAAANRRDIFLPVTRTARVSTVGSPGDHVRELWIVCHGYGQLSTLFIRHFQPIVGDARWILAPEGLSRFYHEMPNAARHADLPVDERRVGAAWLTREERERDIADGVAYLTNVHEFAASHLPYDIPLTVLGFSQGVSVAARWLALAPTPPEVDHFICWSGSVPAELVGDGRRIRAARATLVSGTEDPWVRSGTVEAQQQRLESLGIAPKVVRFHGGHRMDAPTLGSIAGA